MFKNDKKVPLFNPIRCSLKLGSIQIYSSAQNGVWQNPTLWEGHFRHPLFHGLLASWVLDISFYFKTFLKPLLPTGQSYKTLYGRTMRWQRGYDQKNCDSRVVNYDCKCCKIGFTKQYCKTFKLWPSFYLRHLIPSRNALQRFLFIFPLADVPELIKNLGQQLWQKRSGAQEDHKALLQVM